MATGDQTDLINKETRALPTGWYSDSAPILRAVLTGIANAMSSISSMIAYVKLQGRIATATDLNLDIVAFDYLGAGFPRRASESDTAYRVRIRREILAPRGTRTALVEALQNLTGNTPTIFEPSNPGDTGGWGSPNLGWGVAGGWGSATEMPFQFLISIPSPVSIGIPYLSGWGSGGGGWGVGQIAWASRDMATGTVTDQDIYDTITRTIPTATIAWTRITASISGSS